MGCCGRKGSGSPMQAARCMLAGPHSTSQTQPNLLHLPPTLTLPPGNSLGVLGLLFASFESFAAYLANGQIPDEANTLVAGAATGAVYRSVRGPRQAAAAAVVGTAGSALLLAARKFVNPGL